MNLESTLAGMFAAMGAFIIIIIAIVAAIIIPIIIAQWKFFKKAGKQGWEAIVPFYNTWILIEISGLNWWYFLISLGCTLLSTPETGGVATLLTLGSWYVNFNIYYNIAKKTKQNEILYGILGALVPFVPILILGFNNNITYEKDTPVSPNGIF